MDPVERQRQIAQNPTSKIFFRFSKVVVGTLSGPHGSQFGPHGSPTVLATKNAKKTPRSRVRQLRPKRFFFFNFFAWGFGVHFGSPRFSNFPPRFSHGSPENPHGSPTVLRKIPTVLPRFSGKSPRFSHGSPENPHGSPTVLPWFSLFVTTNHCFLEPESPRFSHGSPTVLCKVPTVLPRFFVKSPRFSHGSL